MSDLPAAQRLALEAWAGDATAAGWLAEHDRNTLGSTDTASPSQLFDTAERPLVVGFFGGTGVGKSTLLNRIAGEPIARSGVERPTSRIITVYVHRSVSVDNLPKSFPMRKMRTALHNNDRYRHVLFIDMPDFDSVESANRDLVDIWLPHLDLVLYVVSPDRYRDDQGWRLLLRHASQHAWMFIINHWDRGEPEQLEDFRTQLAEAGLPDPLIYRTDSSNSGSGIEDDFAPLQAALQETADQSVISSLDKLGIVARLKAQKQISDTWLDSLGSEAALRLLSERWPDYWQESSASLAQSLQGLAARHASHYAQQDGSWLQRLRGRQKREQPEGRKQTALVDEPLLQRIDNLVEDFLNQQSQALQLPIAAMKHAVAEPYARVRRDLDSTVNDAIQASLAAPGNRLQRIAHRTLGLLCVLLPMAAMGWIAWRVVYGFTEGGSNPAAYLGSNFAINSALLLGLSWLIPAFAQRKVQPSSEKAAQRGMLNGLENALIEVGDALDEGVARLDTSRQTLRSQYISLWQSLPAPETASLPEPVRRMLAAEVALPAQRVLDVRANTHNSTDNAPES